MKNNYTNINEEIKRIKSLFTEERLYGNLIDSKPVALKGFLMEGAWEKQFGEFLETVWKRAFSADPKLKGLDFPPRSPGDVNIRIEPTRNADGGVTGIRVLRDGVEQDPRAISSYISDSGLQLVKTKVDNISDATTLNAFLRADNEDGLYGVFKTMIDDMKHQNMIDDDAAVKMLDKLKKGKMGEKIQINLDDPKTFTGVYTLEDLKRLEPGLHELFSHIPGLGDAILGNTQKSIGGIETFTSRLPVNKLIGDDTAKVGRVLSRATELDPITSIRRGSNDDITIFTSEGGGEIIFDNGAGTLKIKGDTEALLKWDLGDDLFVSVPNDAGDIIFQVDITKLGDEGQEFIYNLLGGGSKVLDNTTTRTIRKGLQGVNWGYEMGRDNLADAMAATAGSRKGVFQNRKLYGGERTLAKLMEKTKLNLGKAFRVAFRDNDIIDNFRETFSTGFRKHFNIDKLRKERYGRIGAGSNAPNNYNKKQVRFIEIIYEVPEGQNLFVQASDKQLIDSGYFIGEVNPNATKKKYWKQEIYNTWRYGMKDVNSGDKYNAQKVFSIIFNPNEKGKSFSSWQKKIGRGVKLGALWSQMWGWWPCSNLGWCDAGLPWVFQMVWNAVKSVWVMWRNFWLNQIIKTGGDIKIAKNVYRGECLEHITSNVKNRFNKTIGFSEIVMDGMKDLAGPKILGKVIVDKNDFEGDPPEKHFIAMRDNDLESTPKDEAGTWDYDWWEKDSRTIAENKVHYPINDKVDDKNAWMQILKDKNDVFIRVWFGIQNEQYVTGKILVPNEIDVDKKSKLLKKNKMGYADFSVTCMPFGGPNGWFAMTYKKVMGVDLEQLLWDGLWDYMADPLGGVEAAFKQAYKQTVESIDTIMIEYIDPITPDSFEDAKETIKNAKKKAENAIEGSSEGNTYNYDDMKNTNN